jgi:hypothetical protein
VSAMVPCEGPAHCAGCAYLFQAGDDRYFSQQHNTALFALCVTCAERIAGLPPESSELAELINRVLLSASITQGAA